MKRKILLSILGLVASSAFAPTNEPTDASRTPTEMRSLDIAPTTEEKAKPGMNWPLIAAACVGGAAVSAIALGIPLGIKMNEESPKTPLLTSEMMRFNATSSNPNIGHHALISSGGFTEDSTRAMAAQAVGFTIHNVTLLAFQNASRLFPNASSLQSIGIIDTYTTALTITDLLFMQGAMALILSGQPNIVMTCLNTLIYAEETITLARIVWIAKKFKEIMHHAGLAILGPNEILLCIDPIKLNEHNKKSTADEIAECIGATEREFTYNATDAKGEIIVDELVEAKLAGVTTITSGSGSSSSTSLDINPNNISVVKNIGATLGSKAISGRDGICIVADNNLV